MHRILTCRNHPNLRWSCKDEAISNGGYNGTRRLFFDGEPTGEGLYSDASGLNCSTFAPIRNDEGLVTGYKHITECSCPVSDLVIAPEDELILR